MCRGATEKYKLLRTVRFDERRQGDTAQTETRARLKSTGIRTDRRELHETVPLL